MMLETKFHTGKEKESEISKRRTLQGWGGGGGKGKEASAPLCLNSEQGQPPVYHHHTTHNRDPPLVNQLDYRISGWGWRAGVWWKETLRTLRSRTPHPQNHDQKEGKIVGPLVKFVCVSPAFPHPCPRSRPLPPHTSTASRFCPHLANGSLPRSFCWPDHLFAFLPSTPPLQAPKQASHEFWCGCGAATLHPHGCRASRALTEPDPEAEGVLGGAIGGDGDLEPGYGTGACVRGGWVREWGGSGIRDEIVQRSWTEKTNDMSS